MKKETNVVQSWKHLVCWRRKKKSDKKWSLEESQKLSRITVDEIWRNQSGPKIDRIMLMEHWVMSTFLSKEHSLSRFHVNRMESNRNAVWKWQFFHHPCHFPFCIHTHRHSPWRQKHYMCCSLSATSIKCYQMIGVRFSYSLTRFAWCYCSAVAASPRELPLYLSVFMLNLIVFEPMLCMCVWPRTKW